MKPIRSSPGFRALLEERAREREALISTARAYAFRARKALPEARVFVYGSVMRGDFNLASDIDLLVISDGLPESPLERSELLYSFVVDREEPKGLSPGEYERLKARGALSHLEGAIEL